MKENRWRSLSIMDLHLSKRGSFATTSGLSSSSSASSSSSSQAVSGANASSRPQSHQEVPLTNNGQSYELIKSTQSLVERLQLNAEDIAIQPVHPSIIGQDTWFQITYTRSGTTRYFSCQSAKERDEWISSLKKTLMLNEDRRRTDNSLKLDVLEIKGLGDKKKYYVEILIDDKLYARTSSKKITDACCMWCESFSFADLPQTTEKITLLVHKDKGGQSNAATVNSRKKPKKPVGRVKISVGSVTSRYVQDKWYQVEKSNRRETPSIRLRAQYQSIDILPLRDYEEFLYFLKAEYKNLCKLLEPTISIKVKEELANNLMNLFHAEEMAEDVLADLVVDEISNLENEHLTFRGNSIATKAMECYIKLVGEQYLLSTLQTVISDILSQQDLDLEIDPIKVSSNEVLSLHRQSLYALVRQVWHKIVKSHAYFPWQLQRCFYKIRQVLAHIGKSEVGDKMISSCIFLRYLCPAILTPSLFKLTDEYPSEKANRNLTLVAKTLQTLANFGNYESKESCMSFLNQFLAEESETMRNYLKQISSPLAEDYWIPSLSNPVEKADLGKYLSSLHTILFENVAKLDGENTNSVKLTQLLDELNAILKRPTSSKLAQISQTTMETVAEKENKTTTVKSADPPSPPIKNTVLGIPIPWLGTLPKNNKEKKPKQTSSADRQSSTSSSNGSMSVVAPHHANPGTTHIMVEKSPGLGNPSAGAVSAVQVSVGGTPKTHMVNTTLTDHVGVPLSPESSDDSSITPSPNGQSRALQRYNAESTSTSTSSSDILSSGMATTERRHHAPNRPGLDPYLNGRRSHHNHMASSMSLDDTSSDDSTYSSQYQSDANSTPRTGTSQTLPRNLVPKHSTHNTMGMALSNVKVKSMNDYESEILQMRSEMEHLQIKLSEAERRLQFSTNNNSQQIPTITTPTSDSKIIPEIIPDQSNPSNFSEQKMAKEVVQRLTEDEDKFRHDFVLGAPTSGAGSNPDGSDCIEPITDKEKMILMQQKKIAALDAANRRLLEELNKISSNPGINTGNLGNNPSGSGGSSAKVSVTTSPINVTSINTSSNTVSHDRRVSSSSTSSNKSITVITNGEATITSGSGGGTVSPTNQNASPVKSTTNQQASNSLPAQPTGGAGAGSQEIPKRVEELLDSLHSTSI